MLECSRQEGRETIIMGCQFSRTNRGLSQVQWGRVEVLPMLRILLGKTFREVTNTKQQPIMVNQEKIKRYSSIKIM